MLRAVLLASIGVLAATSSATSAEVRGKSFICDVHGRGNMGSTGLRVFVAKSGEVYSLMNGCTARAGSTSGAVSMLNGGPRRTDLDCGAVQGVTQNATFDGGRLVIERNLGDGRRDRFEIAVLEAGARLVGFSRGGRPGRGGGGGGGGGRGGGGGGGRGAIGAACQVGDRPLF